MSPPIVPGGAVPWAHDLEAAADGKAALRRTKHAISPGFRRGSDVRMTGRPVVGGAAILRAADRFSPEPGQGGVAGGPGSACVCDSDCDLDGSPCTADVCNLTTGLCEQTFALGVACVPANPGGADEMFCTAGQCDNAGTCLANDNGGSPCDAVTEACNEATDRCDGNECITDAQCAGGPADPLLCQTNVCVNGRCRLGTVCATGEQCCRTGDHCDVVEGFPVGACFVEQDGRCCDATQTCTTSTLAGCAGPWHIEGDLATPGVCNGLCPKFSRGINDNGGVTHPFELYASEACTVEGIPGAAIFNRIGDDYVTANNGFLLLDTLRFRGGVSGDGDKTIVFEFWDGSVTPPGFVNQFVVSFGPNQTGIFEWTITLGAPITIPPVGWVTMRPAIGGGETVIWVSSNDDPGTSVGGNNANLMWADDEQRDVLGAGNDVLSFEVAGSKIDPTGACCQGEGLCNDAVTGDTNLKVPWLCEAAGGTFIAGESCANSPCTVATCCFGDGSCSVLDPGACTAQGGVVGTFGGTCSPNCCPQLFSAGETCGTESVKLLDTLNLGTATARYSGDTGNATHGHCSTSIAQTCNSFVPSGGPEPDSCPFGEVCVVDEACLNNDSDAGHWEAFEITADSEVRIGYCCSDTNDAGAAGVRWIIVVDDCALCTNEVRDAEATCADGNAGDTYLLSAGTYHYAVFASRICVGTADACSTDADCAPGVACVEQTGTYELEIEATRLPFVTCCFQDICVDETSPNPVTTLECAAQGGFELVGVSTCFGGPCAAGACCVGPGNCQDVTDLASCDVLGGTFVGGADCALDAPCPICALDDLVAGGPDCQAANGGWLLASDRNLNPPVVLADDFTAVSGGPLTQICFEATYFLPAGTCCADSGSQLPDLWNITVFDDLGGLPGPVLGPAGGQILQNVASGAPTACTQTKSGSGLTGIILTSGDCYWIEISGFGEGEVGNPPVQGCMTGLLSSLDGNNYMVRGAGGVYTPDDIVTDLVGDPQADFGFCVEGGMVLCDRNAACCLDPNGPPPPCQVLSSADCLAVGGLFTPNQVCDPGVCPAPCEAETCVDQISLNQPGEACEFGLPCDRPYTNVFCNNTFQATPCGNQGADSWYSYTTGPNECGDLTISTCGGNFDGFLSVYDGGPNCDCPVDESAPLACDDDFCGPGGMSQVTFTANADTCYLIRAGGWQTNVGSGTLQLSIVADPGACVATTPAPVLADPAIDINGNTAACASDADCTCNSICRNGMCYPRKGRFVSVSPNPANAGANIALRVCVDAPGPGTHCRWVDAPGPPIVHQGAGPQPLQTANLLPDATPVYRDWSLDQMDSDGNVVVHIGGCAVSNGHDYYIQAITEGANPGNEANFSPALVLPTSAVFGDVDGNSVANAGDVFHLVRAFQNIQVLPRTWLKIMPSGDNAADPGMITLTDALGAVHAFQGETYLDQPGSCAPAGCAPDVGNCDDLGSGEIPPPNSCPGGPSGCQVVADPAVLIQLVPVSASGVEGVDWEPGPGPNEITLTHGGQDVAVEVFVENFGANTVAAYQFGLDCNYSFSVAGSIDPYSAQCPDAGLPFDSGQCLGIDVSRPDLILASAVGVITGCQATDICPNGLAGKFACGAIANIGAPAPGAGAFYGATFGFAVSADAEGVTEASVDLDPSETFMLDGDGCMYLLESVTPANIIIVEATGRCCGDPGAPLQCSDGVTLNQCLAVGGGFTAGGVCSGVEGPTPGLDSACLACTDDIECDDGVPCTDDVCNVNGICTNIQDVRLCCNPETGAKMLIDDENLCTDDVCDPLTGLVTHVGSATDGVCAAPLGSRYIGATPPCGLAGTCDETTLVAMALSVEVGPALIDLGFIQPDGSLADTPAFDTPATWGTVEITGGFIRPSTTYVVTLVPMAGVAGGSTSSATTATYADVDGNGLVNFADIQIVVLVFLGDPLFVDLLGDLNPCVPNHVVNFADIQAVVLAFQGGSFVDACPLGVCCFVPGNPTCGPFNDFGPGALEEECPPPGVWTEGGVCGPNAECP